MIRAALISLGLWVAGGAGAQCRLALVLGLDVSGSVDGREYRLQMDGLAGALASPGVADALLAMPAAPVQIAVFEWSGPDHQHLLLDWTPITGRPALGRVIALLRGTRRHAASRSTALGVAMETGAALLEQRRECWQRTLDISGDGKDNTGPPPARVHRMLEHLELTINALVIGADSPATGDTRQAEIGELSSYFNAHVKTGPGAFVQTALGFDDYQIAMERKLRRELRGPVLSRLDTGDESGAKLR